MEKPAISPLSFVLPGAQIVGEVTLAPGASVWYNAVLRGDEAPITVGENSNLQDGCVVHVDRGRPTVIGREVTVGHGCILHGCTVGDRCLVGMGSILLSGAVLEDGCMVGAGSLVTEGVVIPSGMLAFGRPARVIRPLSPEERQNLGQAALRYVEAAKSALAGPCR